MRSLLTILAGVAANAVGLYLLTHSDPKTSPIAIVFFALVGAGVVLGVGGVGWIAAPLSLYIGLLVPTISLSVGNEGVPNYFEAYKSNVVWLVPIALVEAAAAAAASVASRGWRRLRLNRQ